MEDWKLSRPRALVIGGSVGGLFAAHLLRSIGWDVAVFERAAGDLGDRGTGIGTREDLFAVMRRIGLAVDASIGVEVLGRIGLDRHGNTIGDLPVRAVTSAWSRIWRPLRRALPDPCYSGGKTLKRIDPLADGIAAVFDDGTRTEGEFLIAADGLHSTVRAQLLGDASPSYAGYVAWRGVVQPEKLAPALRDLALRRMLFGFPDGELMLSIPMPVPVSQSEYDRTCHFVWFRPATEDRLSELCTDASGRRHGISIPPPLIREELITQVRREAEALLAPQLATLVNVAPQIILQPIFDLQVPCMVSSRVALLGDAAFVARPHVASGVMKAAVDAATLADALAAGGDVVTALQRYNRERQPYGVALVARGRHIGATIVTRSDHPEGRAELLMREYGSAGLVRDQPITARVGG